MMWSSTAFLSVVSLLFANVAAFPNPGTVSGATSGVHDPSALCKDSSGTYFLFSTGAGLPIRTSTDRINFKSIGNVWPSGASWTNIYTGKANGDLWAPDCTYKNGQFYLYYSASQLGSQTSGIFLARSSNGQPGSWTNDGLVLASSPSNPYNAIDANLFIDGSSWYMSFGSFWNGIYAVPLSSSTGKPSGSPTSVASRGGGAIEASGIFKSGSYYYLFTSWDKCCSGTSSTYNVRVGRATSPLGPYVDQAGVKLTSGGGTRILASHGNIIGPGGQSVYQDADATVLVYHWYTSTTSNLGINLLNFSSGWPVVY